MNEILDNISVFENIKHIDELGNEYWSARDLNKVLEYSEYRKFLPALKKQNYRAKIAGFVLMIISLM